MILFLSGARDQIVFNSAELFFTPGKNSYPVAQEYEKISLTGSTKDLGDEETTIIAGTDSNNPDEPWGKDKELRDLIVLSWPNDNDSDSQGESYGAKATSIIPVEMSVLKDETRCGKDCPDDKKWDDKTLADVYKDHGPEGIIGETEKLTDLKADNYIEINYSTLPNLINELGDIRVTLTHPLFDEDGKKIFPADDHWLTGEEVLLALRAQGENNDKESIENNSKQSYRILRSLAEVLSGHGEMYGSEGYAQEKLLDKSVLDESFFKHSHIRFDSYYLYDNVIDSEQVYPIKNLDDGKIVGDLSEYNSMSNQVQKPEGARALGK